MKHVKVIGMFILKTSITVIMTLLMLTAIHHIRPEWSTIWLF